MKSLNLNKLNAKERTIVSSEKALEDITPIDWRGYKMTIGFDYSSEIKEIYEKLDKLIQKSYYHTGTFDAFDLLDDAERFYKLLDRYLELK